MIITKLQGGMGNTMFQFAMGLAQAQRLNTNLLLDASSFQRDSIRQYSLGLWEGIKEPITLGHRPTIRERGMPYNQTLVDSIKDGDVLNGYWQTEKYFFHLKGRLRQIFTPAARLTDYGFETLKEILNLGERSCFVTVRRTDYLNTDYHGVLPQEYYNQAALEVYKSVGKPPVFFVFSDEPEWCKKNFYLPHGDFKVVGSFNQTSKNHLGREDEDLWLMKYCHNAIMANSSFSWWGAWLNSIDGIEPRAVIAPKKWFNNSPEDPRDIVPERWMTL